MQRWLSVLVGAAVVAVLVVLTTRGMSSSSTSSGASTSTTASVVGDGDGGAAIGAGALGSATPASAILGLGGDAGAADLPGDFEAGFRLPDGSPVPALGDRAPKQVRFGVILVAYDGAQGAPAKARPKRDALEIARRLGDDARSDFRGAVARGDNGSTDDAGHMTRGVLEPAPEYVLFTLPVGGVGGPVDTPRGFWIVKRIE